jgi:hypothetical protein
LSDPETSSKIKPWQRPWFRLYTEVLDDPKVQRLPDALFKTWINALCIAARNNGKLPPIADLAFSIRLSEKDASKRVAQLIAAGLLDRDGEELTLHNWGARQPKSDTSTDRVKRFRERSETVSGGVSGNGVEPFQETARNAECNALESESESDTDSSSSSEAHTDDDGLLEKLREAAAGHIAPRCSDVGSIRELISKGCDLQRDVLSAIGSRVPSLKKPLSTWRAAWLHKEILANRDARTRRTSPIAPQGFRRKMASDRRDLPVSAPAHAAGVRPTAAAWRSLGDQLRSDPAMPPVEPVDALPIALAEDAGESRAAAPRADGGAR